MAVDEVHHYRRALAVDLSAATYRRELAQASIYRFGNWDSSEVLTGKQRRNGATTQLGDIPADRTPDKTAKCKIGDDADNCCGY